MWEPAWWAIRSVRSLPFVEALVAVVPEIMYRVGSAICHSPAGEEAEPVVESVFVGPAGFRYAKVPLAGHGCVVSGRAKKYFRWWPPRATVGPSGALRGCCGTRRCEGNDRIAGLHAKESRPRTRRRKLLNLAPAGGELIQVWCRRSAPRARERSA